MREAARRATQEQRAAVEPAERKALRTLEKRGVTVRSVNRLAFRDAVRPLWAKFAAEHPSARPILADIVPPGG